MVARIIQLVDQQVVLGQAIENVFNFVDEAGAASIPDLLGVYVSDVLPLCRALQSTSCQHTNIRWREVYPTQTLVQDYATGLPVAGTDGNDLEPSSTALSFKWILGNPTVVLAGGFTGHIKRGGMRLGGICEGLISGNGISAGIAAVARAYTDELLNPGGDAWRLCVASFLVGNPVHGGPARARSETVTAYTIVSTATDPSPSTQNTRKFLRGIAS